MIRRGLVLLAFALSVPARHLAAGETQAAQSDPLNLAGWYATNAGSFLISIGPKGGYRLLDFQRARFHALKPTSPDQLTVSGDGTWEDARIQIVRKSPVQRPTLTIRPASGPPTTASPAREYPFDLQEVQVPANGATLGGLLLLPRVRKLIGRSGAPLKDVDLKLPAVTVLHGSGDSDRDNVWAFTFAFTMARAGFVTLFLDKRGSGASSGDWRTVGLDGLADDAIAGLALLRDHHWVDARRVGVLGLSQGGLVAALATARRRDVAFAVSISAAPLPLFVQMRHELTQDLRRAGVPDAGIAAVLAVSDLAAEYSRTLSNPAWSAYTSALEQLRAGAFGKAAAAFPASRSDWHWQWWRLVGDVDPLPAWRDFGSPALAVFGADDEHDNVPVAKSVQLLQETWRPETHPSKVVRVFPARGHTLADPNRRWIDQDILNLIGDWSLHAVGGLDPQRRSPFTSPRAKKGVPFGLASR